jgi:hypothetical protein
MILVSFEQVDEYAEAGALVDGDLIPDRARVYVAKKHKLQDGSSELTCELLYMFEEYF